MKPDLKNQNTVVLGAGRSGRAAARLLLRAGARVTLQDENNVDDLTELVRAGCAVQIAAEANPAAAVDLVVISPGIDPRKPWVRSYQDRGIPIWSELELAWRFCDWPVVAITGTNGKTTTTELVEAVFKACGLKAVASGNIGMPLAETICSGGTLDVVALEVSSFQLEYCHTFAPRVAVHLNLTPDHMDRYDSMEEYAAAKNRIFMNQTPDDVAVVNARLDCPPLRARKVTFSAFESGADYTLSGTAIVNQGQEVFDLGKSLLKGIHNAENVMAVLAVADAWNLPLETVASAICAYRPAPHRCEFVGTINGVTWMNDSKATNPDALAKALLSQPGKVLLIAGGKDKGFTFEALRGIVGAKVRKVFLIGETAPQIARDWAGCADIEHCGQLERAVAAAAAEATAGEVVLFSPACSSFDQFKNYQDRGDQFKNLALRMGRVEAKQQQEPALGGIHQENKTT
ncbi:UDP-N-acetylmuramoyl-L-alanine--D-glutamate ligase [Oscillatoria amoena NRMC-F 0135]|nr:UDP-N-acetylmuramoyl-L-alanine--D-glutamate ligase [Oscillatoria amoena NRMC-F 0135]